MNFNFNDIEDLGMLAIEKSRDPKATEKERKIAKQRFSMALQEYVDWKIAGCLKESLGKLGLDEGFRTK